MVVVEVNGYTIEPGADLAQADLRWADLREADLRGANFLYANLDGARLDGALLEGAKFFLQALVVLSFEERTFAGRILKP